MKWKNEVGQQKKTKWKKHAAFLTGVDALYAAEWSSSVQSMLMGHEWCTAKASLLVWFVFVIINIFKVY